ncbi:hypothetical protein F5B22DRAFT_639916 [Xylaria bambusicola]|uniref:uncharacterized protein n=1 Tax=Xylaria bambusicola TaxID=326684 RepID=UPI002007A1FB|nr:uncharacterized protein F5B22DRAFT_639916 [Xylaria bambusicola]KAI0505465.1 hypothetical protein F5B22DRAFT_639916 [Xylaria bambusicola]
MSSNNPFARLVNAPASGVKSRLAVLEPADSQNAPIKLTLIDADLEGTSYECISYERAKNAKTVYISVDNEDFEVPEALESALRTFRRKEEPRTLWADLLVGRTAEERILEGTTIRQVLANADKTLCWLGPEKSALSSRAFDVIHEMANRWHQARLHVNLSQDVSLSRATMQQLAGIKAKLREDEFPALAARSSDYLAIWDALFDAVGSAYFTCVQSIPEIVLAKEAFIVCGRSNIRWSNYVGAVRAFPLFHAKYRLHPILPHVEKASFCVNAIEIAERRRRLGDTLELFPMIQTARDCGAEDPRDYVFSMIPLSTSSERVKKHSAGPQPLPRVDFSKTAQQVFIEAARYTVLERQDLLVWLNERVPCARRIRDLPSWVPDFSAGSPSQSHVSVTENGLRAWWETVSPRKTIRVREDDNALLVQAYVLDRVEHVSRVFDSGNFSSLCYEEYRNLPAPSNNETVEDRDERFWRTLLMNLSSAFTETLGSQKAAPSAVMGASFHSLMAQEAVLKLLDCTPHELRTPEIQARMRNMPEVMALLPKCGKGQYFAAQFGQLSLGRRFFRTSGGQRFGMTAVEDVVSVDPKLRVEEREAARGELGDAANANANANDDLHMLTRMAGGNALDPLSQMMMMDFRSFLQARDPEMASAFARAERGELFPAQREDRARGGVAKGDVVVAIIGGFFPYILRPKLRGDDGNDDDEHLVVSDSAYEFVGDCYLHGSMNGEDFKVGSRYNTDVSKIVDISIV